MRRYGVEGRRLWRLARGIDDRRVNPERETKSVSAETTFNTTSPTTRRWKSCSGRSPSGCRRA